MNKNDVGQQIADGGGYTSPIAATLLQIQIQIQYHVIILAKGGLLWTLKIQFYEGVAFRYIYMYIYIYTHV